MYPKRNDPYQRQI